MDTDTIPDVPNDNPETYCRLCFSGFYVEPIFPRDGPPRDALLDLITQHVDIHLSPEADHSCMVCRMCQMTLESFHKYRTRCRALDEVLQRRRQELAEFRVKEEKVDEQPAPVRGFERDMIYCLSDSDAEDDDHHGEQGEEQLEPEDQLEEYEEVEEDEEDLIRGDMLVKPEPYGVDGRAAGYEEGGDAEQEEYQQPQILPRKRERFDTDEVVLLDSDEEDGNGGGGDGDDGERSMAASTRASSEAPGQADDPEPDKALPYEVTEDGAYRCTICKESFRLMKEIKSHIRKAHPKDSLIYSCKHCPKKFWDLSILRVHNRHHTMDFPFSCNECGAKFTLKERMDVHMAKYHDKNSPQYTEKRFNCPLCPRIFMQEQGRQRHIRNFHEVQPDTLEMENSPLPNNFVYYCELCEVSFDTLEESKAHITDKHPREEGEEADANPASKVVKRCKCPDCGRLFRSRTAFRAHFLSNHGSNMPVVCDVCGSGFLRQSQLNHHKERWHGENARNKGALERYKCDHCERFFMRNQDRIRHEQIIHQIETPEKLPAVWEGRKGNFPCSKCDRKFPTMKTMRIHFSLKHPDVAVRFKCNVCAKLFKHKQTLRDHMLNHTGEQPFHCPDEQCNERFIRKKDYDRHMLDFHGPDDSGDDEKKKTRFPCPHCPRKLLSRVARLMHIRHHHKDVSESTSAAKQMIDDLTKDSNQCTYCPKIFNNRNTLKLHLMNHMGKLPHPCDQCDASYYKPTDLEKHKLRYHPGGSALSLANRFKCAYCPRVFVRKTGRRYHQTVFHGVKAPPRKGAGAQTGRSRGQTRIKPDPDMVYPCSLCSLTFKSSSMIQEHHQQQHPDQELFYKCPHCPHRTVNRQAFLSHVRLHSGGPRYPCDECTATFDRKLSLVTHKKRYHGTESKDGSPVVAKFKCSVCPREFMRNQDRVRHQVQMHDYRVKASADKTETPGPSKAGRSVIKIKQEQPDPKPAAISTARDGFSVSSDVEEETELITADADNVGEGEEEEVPSVPTIACVVSIKQEKMATRRDTEF